jgi:hypothetical protein
MLINRSLSQHLPALLLVGLVVLEREPTGPLVRARLPADATVARGEHDAPERDGGKERGAKRTESEAEYAGFGPHGVAVECGHGVEHGGYRERREGIRSLGIGDRGRGA